MSLAELFVENFRILFGQSIYALLICASNPVSRQIALIVNEQCRHGHLPHCKDGNL